MKPGDKLVCLKKGNWQNKIDNDNSGPKHEEIVTFNEYSLTSNNYIRIEEYLFDDNGRYQAFNIKWFIPLDHWKQAEYMVEELKEELEVTV